MNKNCKSRKLSPYEKTHLQRFGKGNIALTKDSGIPVEYLTGKVEFGEHVFAVNQDVLIPRIETEEIISLAQAELEKLRQKKFFIADVGCGSGVIGLSLWLALQKKGYEIELYLSDISKKALWVAQKNVDTLIGESEQIHLLNSDLLQNYPPQIKFDLIVANLPYIPSARVKVLDQSVRNYEPHLALDGGKNGLKYIKELVIKQAKQRLNPKGKILLEVDYTHDEKYLRENLDLAGLKLTALRDQFKRIRFATLCYA